MLSSCRQQHGFTQGRHSRLFPGSLVEQTASSEETVCHNLPVSRYLPVAMLPQAPATTVACSIIFHALLPHIRGVAGTIRSCTQQRASRSVAPRLVHARAQHHRNNTRDSLATSGSFQALHSTSYAAIAARHAYHFSPLRGTLGRSVPRRRPSGHRCCLLRPTALLSSRHVRLRTSNRRTPRLAPPLNPRGKAFRANDDARFGSYLIRDHLSPDIVLKAVPLRRAETRGSANHLGSYEAPRAARRSPRRMACHAVRRHDGYVRTLVLHLPRHDSPLTTTRHDRDADARQ